MDTAPKRAPMLVGNPRLLLEGLANDDRGPNGIPRSFEQGQSKVAHRLHGAAAVRLRHFADHGLVPQSGHEGRFVSEPSEDVAPPGKVRCEQRPK